VIQAGVPAADVFPAREGGELNGGNVVLGLVLLPLLFILVFILGVVFALQVAVGAGSALTDGNLFNGLHVALATLVWSGTLVTAMLTLPRADRDVQTSRLAVEKGTA